MIYDRDEKEKNMRVTEFTKKTTTAQCKQNINQMVALLKC